MPGLIQHNRHLAQKPSMILKNVFLACLLFICCHANAQVRLPSFFRDSMVLQRDADIQVWGWASAGEKVKIKFQGKNYSTTAAANGEWKLQLDPAKAGGPFTLSIQGKNKIILKEILIGDVWICSGQSNMVHQMRLHNIMYADEIASATNAEIRQCFIPNITNLQRPQNNLPDVYWKSVNPVDINEFSAVAYFFAKKLYAKYHVPIGIINASWGGSPIEAWMSEESLQPFASYFNTVQKNKDSSYVNDVNRKAAAARQLPTPADKGMEEKWYDTAYSPKGWRNIAIPGYWEDQGVADVDGIVWYRREIDIPASMANQPAKVFLGRIVDADALYINGKLAGTTSYLYPQRRYAVTPGILKAGKNIFTIRVTNYSGKGGFVPNKPYYVVAGKDTVDLTGYWQYKVGQVIDKRFSASLPPGIALQNQPTALFNAMLSPLIGYYIKGFVWYQGESNVTRFNEYTALQNAMINDWRSKWHQPELPFLFAQLPGFMDYHYLPAESEWASFRQAQAASLVLPNTGMAVTIDLGEWNDIHPDRKKEVGERLALAAEKIVYGESIISEGPTFQSAIIKENKIILSFNNIGSGLTTSDGEAPAEFAVAGADKKFSWVKSTIENDKVILACENTIAPVYVRYAWADNPVNPNLINKEALPAAPFEAIIH